MQEEVLEKQMRVLGEKHPSTIAAMNNLAITLRQQRQLEKKQPDRKAAAHSPAVMVKRSSAHHTQIQSASSKRTEILAFFKNKVQQ
jgi:hypothetical protein